MSKDPSKAVQSMSDDGLHIDSACWSDRNGSQEWIDSNFTIVSKQDLTIVILTDPSSTWECGSQASELFLDFIHDLPLTIEARDISFQFEQNINLASHLARQSPNINGAVDTNFDLIAVFIAPHEVNFCWSGGAIGILLNGTDSSIAYHTRPHLIGEDRVLAGIPRSKAYGDGMAFIRTRSAGSQPGGNAAYSMPEWSPPQRPLGRNDRILLASNSVWHSLSSASGYIEAPLIKKSTAHDVAHFAKKAGALCDVSAILINYR